jgi:hypothetical protein
MTPYQPAKGGGLYDSFVTKLNNSGSALLYSTYLGGSASDYGYGIAVDGSGNTYVTGFTESTDFPTASPLQPDNAGGYDAFVAKFNPQGSALLFSTFLGGNSDDGAQGVAVDGLGNVHVTGDTSSTDFPTLNPFQQEHAGSKDVFMAKLNSTGSALLYATFLGGSNLEEVFGIVLDASGHTYLMGTTSSTNFPTAAAFQQNLRGTQDAFVVKFNTTGSALLYSTYLGGTSLDGGGQIAVDSSGNAYVSGYTESANFPVVNATQQTYGGARDAFLARFNAAGSALLYSTYFGGSSGESGDGIALDTSGNAYLTGYTESANVATANPVQPLFGGSWDAFIAKISVDPPVKKVRGQLVSQ